MSSLLEMLGEVPSILLVVHPHRAGFIPDRGNLLFDGTEKSTMGEAACVPEQAGRRT